MTKTTIELPKYAWKYDHPANQPGDVSATFYEDGDDGPGRGGGSITVNIQCGEGEVFFLSIERGGISESMFTGGELARVIEVAGCLAKHLKIMP
jgi:hypothetical protein